MIDFETYHDIIESLAAALDAKDYYTAGHSTRVGNIAYALSEKLFLDNHTSQMIHIAGHLHDIGKIGVPDNVLNKKGKLDLHEWELMKRHSEIGYNILSKTNSLKEISYMVLHHHENWNGTGYPAGLSHKEIPLGSRIIAICDSIDAMRSNRPYKQAISDIDCYNEILKNRSILYDPEIVDCILENWYYIVVPHYL